MASTRSRASAPRCRLPPRRSCSTTAPETALWRQRASTPRWTRRSRWGNGAGRVSTTPNCCAARGGGMRCCLMRTPSCSRGRRARSTRRCRGGPTQRARAPRCAGPPARGPLPEAARRPRRGASPRRSPPSRARSYCTAGWSCKASGPAPARSTGASPPHCSCAQRPPRRSATSTLRSSSTPTRWTLQGACATPTGAACGCPRRWPSTTSNSPPTQSPSDGS